MNFRASFVRTRSLRFAALLGALLTAASAARAQSVAAAAPTPQQLARYDTNKNGRLDADELAAMEKEAAAARSAASLDRATGAGPEEIVVLTPFEVNSAQDRGYQATSAMSGTRLNTKHV